MARHPLWNDDYWLLLLQLYLTKPVGVKPLYSRALVSLSLELHIEPQFLYRQLFQLRQKDTPRMQRLWETYGEDPRRLKKAVAKLRAMKGFNHADAFYAGVTLHESFERLFRPLPEEPRLLPVMLVMILDLYFRLTPITMVEDTPEVRQLAKLMAIPPTLVVDVMDVFLYLDPCITRRDSYRKELLPACQQIWQQYGNENPEILTAKAAQYKAYFE
ncbi:hypothetical protein [Prevotella sp. AGR2160]|uniref:hypothetical protein n=1 Tax=Prevotella sp. AGR2160 TaxID=1280674 RepID=UPI00042323A2|nr:hypothetical protein [Prevotella sp. AGR2160]